MGESAHDRRLRRQIEEKFLARMTRKPKIKKLPIGETAARDSTFMLSNFRRYAERLAAMLEYREHLTLDERHALASKLRGIIATATKLLNDVEGNGETTLRPLKQPNDVSSGGNPVAIFGSTCKKPL